MKRDAEVKPSMRCSEEPVAGDGSICAVSITERAKLEEPEAGDVITSRSPKLLAADGAGVAVKRALSPEKPSTKEKGAEEKSKRSKRKRAEEKNKQPVVNDLSMEEKVMAEEKNKQPVVNDLEEKVMAKLAELDVKRAEEESWRSNHEKRMEEMLMRIEKIASQVEQVASDGMKKEKRTKEKRTKKPEGIEVREMADNEASGMRKKKVVTWRLSKKLLNYLRTKEVMGLIAAEAPLPLGKNKVTEVMFPFDEELKEKGEIQLKERIAAEFQENRDFDAHVLYQYRTKGYAEIEEEVSDKEDDMEVDGILVGKKRARKPEKPSKKEKVAEEKSKRSNQEKRHLTMEAEINAQLVEAEKNKKKRLVMVKLSQPLMANYLFYEVFDYMVFKPMVTFQECSFQQVRGIGDSYTDARFFASRRRSIETQANVLQQYRTNGSAVIPCEVTDDEAE